MEQPAVTNDWSDIYSIIQDTIHQYLLMYLNDVEGYEILIKPLLMLKVPVFYFKLIWMKIKIVEKLPENMINSFIQPWI